MKTNPNDPASPCKTFRDVAEYNTGFSKRESMALRFASEYIASGYNAGIPFDQVARVAVKAADALIAALNETSTSKP